MLTAKLQGLVQEDMRVRCRTKDSGQRINTKVIHRLAVGNSKVFKTKAKKREIDTIVEVMIDNSGSMTNRRTSKGETLISEARKAQLSLAFALDKLEGVSVTASAFPTAHKDSTQVIELLSEGESVKKLAKRMSVVCGTADNTPSASAMWHSIRKVVESQKQRKIILFVTDGDPNPDQAESLKHLVTKAEKNGIVVIGIAIGPIATNKSRFYRHFSNAIFIQDAAELKTEMFKVAQNLISG
jgi:cobalamin biosynthesis protein CobT